MSGALDRLKPAFPAAEETRLDAAGTGRAVHDVRKELGISQKALALEMRIAQAYLCDLEQGHRGWTLALFNEAKEALARLTKSK